MTDPVDEPLRDDHAELIRRRALTEDAARPDAIERRHAAKGRTARENVAELIDPDSFVEYGRFAIAAQRFRRDVDDLVARTPADGLVAGTARIDGSPCAVLAWPFCTNWRVLPQGSPGPTRHCPRLRRRPFVCCRRYCRGRTAQNC